MFKKVESTTVDKMVESGRFELGDDKLGYKTLSATDEFKTQIGFKLDSGWVMDTQFVSNDVKADVEEILKQIREEA